MDAEPTWRPRYDPVVEERRSARAAAAVAALVASSLAAAFSRTGVLYDPDSGAYLSSAQVLIDDPFRLASMPSGGLMDLPGTWGPLYSILLACVGAAVGLTEAARLIGIVAAGATFGGLALLIGRHASTRATVLSLLAIAAVRGLVQLPFGFALSEGPFLALLVWAMVVADGPPGPTERADDSMALPRAAAVGTLLGLAALTRYAGAAAVVAAAGYLAVTQRPVRRAAASAAIVLGVGLAPLLLWAITNPGNGAVGARELAWHPREVGDLDLFPNLVQTYLPGPAVDALPPVARGLLGAAFVVLTAGASLRWAVHARRTPRSATRTTIGLLLVVAWSQLAAVVGTRLLLDPYLGIGGRTVLPWLTLLLAATGIAAAPTLDPAASPPRSRRTLAAYGLVLPVIAIGCLTLVRDLARPSDAWWHVRRLDPAGDIERTVQRLDPGPHRFTNDQASTYLVTGDLYEQVEISMQDHTFALGDTVPMSDAVAAIASEGGALVLIIDGTMPIEPPEVLIERHGLVEVARGPTWAVLTCDGGCRPG
jgi:hypothetical protein